MRAVVVSHGMIKEFESAREIMKSGDIVICADGGAEYAIRCGITPDVLIGDFDSIDSEILNKIKNLNCKIIKYPKEKDYTDTELAVNYAVDGGYKSITILGGIGERLDHTLANIFLLLKLAGANIEAKIINEKNVIYVINDKTEICGDIGDTLSLIPVGGDVRGIYTEGLKYKLSGRTIAMGSPIGVSNVFTSEKAKVKIESGYLLIIKSKD
ncbi:MAG: thiamine diphosphokinase [Clostridiales bacterium]|nr:thiamine diphosphokinase [Clostridiales bacterium]